MQQQSNIKKTIEPQVYGLLTEYVDTVFLSIQYAYSLEEAFMLAKLEFERLNPATKGRLAMLGNVKIGLYTIKSIKDLMENRPSITEIAKKLEVESKTPTETVIIPVVPDKNQIMAEIVKNKDKKMFREKKELFSINERKYIQEQLKGEVKS